MFSMLFDCIIPVSPRMSGIILFVKSSHHTLNIVLINLIANVYDLRIFGSSILG